MLAQEASRGQACQRRGDSMHTQHNINTEPVWFTDPPDFEKTTLAKVVRVSVFLLDRRGDGRTSEAQANFGFTDRSESASKRQLSLLLLIPFSCIQARRHRVWSRAFIHEGFSFLTSKKKRKKEHFSPKIVPPIFTHALPTNNLVTGEKQCCFQCG